MGKHLVNHHYKEMEVLVQHMINKEKQHIHMHMMIYCNI